MAHEITKTDHKVSGEGVLPWHKLGTVVQGLMTSDEALDLARLTWKVVKTPFKNPLMPDADSGLYAICREDTKDVLGCVSSRYEPIQNHEMLRVLDPVIGTDACYETAGSLMGGKKVFITAKLNETHMLNSWDALETRLLLYVSHDGTGAACCKFVNTRVVCNNTLTVALNEAGNSFKIYHTMGYQQKLDEAHEILKLAKTNSIIFVRGYQSLQDEAVSTDGASKFVDSLFKKIKEDRNINRNIEDSDTDETSSMMANRKDRIISLFKNGTGNEGKTKAGLLSGVTEYYTHEVTRRGSNASENAFLDNMIGGTNNRIKATAYKMLLASVG